MFTHAQIWAAIDRLARRRNMTASALARHAGLDATAFNRSKRRIGRKLRWPSTESLAKILHASNLTLVEFALMVQPEPSGDPDASYPQASRNLAVLPTSQADLNFLVADAPHGPGEKDMRHPGFTEGGARYAAPEADQALYSAIKDTATAQADISVEPISSLGGAPACLLLTLDKCELPPYYQLGQRLVVGTHPAILSGQHMLLKPREGALIARIFQRATEDRVEFLSVDSQDKSIAALSRDAVSWMAPILWASQ